MRSGIGNAAVEPNANLIFIQSLICSALNEVAKQAIIDTSILTFHQLEVEVYYRREQGVELQEDANGNIIVYSPEEEKQMRDNLRNIVWKYHILHPNGLVARLTPIITYIQSGETIPEQVMAADPFLETVVTNHSRYTQAVASGNTQHVVSELINFQEVTDMTEEQYENLILSSRNDGYGYVDTAIYEDGTTQCNCSYCYNFFQVAELEPDYNNLNYLQHTMLQHF